MYNFEYDVRFLKMCIVLAIKKFSKLAGIIQYLFCIEKPIRSAESESSNDLEEGAD